ncbi:MAG: tetratricopeptide repeat protein [Chloroflexales bacterium]|nr:tetratricopeptide repeat protein [Chloroflexales bacterium]
MLLLTALGPLHVALDGNPLHFRTNKAQALLIYLAVAAATQPAAAHRREALMELLWPGLPLSSAQDNLRQTLYQLRKTLPAVPSCVGGEPVPLLLTDRQTVQLNPACAYDLDVATFLRLLRDDPTPTMLAQALTLYRGDFLADFYLADSDTFEAWAAAQRATLHRQALDALDRMTATLLAQGAYDQAEAYARRQIELDELCEGAHRQLMIALARRGRRRQALAQYATWRQLLADELGITPSTETVMLYERIRDQAPDMQLQDQGQSVASTTPETTLAVRLSRPLRHNLPAPSTSFVGREDELAAIAQRLADPGCRLVTLIGPGGIGKSRLALQAASDLVQSGGGLFRDGVYLVRLAAVPSMDHLIPAIAAAIGFAFAGVRDPTAQLLAFLQAKAMLLVLDNMEHLAHVATGVADLLQAGPGLKVLVTSRVRLNLYEEWLIELPGLGAPEHAMAGDVAHYDAIKLFIQRARQVVPDFSLAADTQSVVQVCRLCAGMPLGIELAASWVKTYSCQEIVTAIQRDLDFLSTNLQNISARHRSLRIAFEHSWRLLADESRAVFARLSVFRGGFDHAAALAVADASRGILSRLVDNSMVHRSAGRYQVHELLRQFGEEKLAELDPDAVNRRHAAYYGAYLQQREHAMRTVQEPVVLGEIKTELDNIQAGWRWAIASLNSVAQSETTLNLICHYAPMLAYFYDRQSRFHEGVTIFEQPRMSLTAAWQKSADSDPLVTQKQTTLAQLQVREATLRFRLGQFVPAEQLLQECLPVLRAVAQHHETAEVLVWMGMIYVRKGMYEQATRCLHESLALYRQIGEHHASAEALTGLGMVTMSQGCFAAAHIFFEQCLAIYQESGYQRGIAGTLSNLGSNDIWSKQYAQAKPRYIAALTAARAASDNLKTAVVLSNLGSISRILADYAESIRFYEQSLEMFREMDERRWIAASLNGLGLTLLDTGDCVGAQQHLQEGLVIATAIHSVPDALDSMAALGELLARGGAQSQAVAVLSFVTHQTITKPLARDRSEHVLAQLKDELPTAVWEAAWEQGKAQTLAAMTNELMERWQADSFERWQVRTFEC